MTMELSQELTTRMEEASKDTVWTEKLRTAADWDTCAALLGEKGVAVPAELQGAFGASCASKTGKLEDAELEQVSGGVTFYHLFCIQRYNLWCDLVKCPYLVRKDSTPDPLHYELRCTLHDWVTTNDYFKQEYSTHWNLR